MIITDEWIAEHRPCQEAIDWWDKKERNALVLLRRLIEQEHYRWANWFIVRVMTQPQYLAYAIFAAEQALPLYEAKFPDNRAPHHAIEATKAVLANDSAENRNAADAAYAAAGAAADAAAYAAAHAAARAAEAAAGAAQPADAAYAVDADPVATDHTTEAAA